MLSQNRSVRTLKIALRELSLLRIEDSLSEARSSPKEVQLALVRAGKSVNLMLRYERVRDVWFAVAAASTVFGATLSFLSYCQFWCTSG